MAVRRVYKPIWGFGWVGWIASAVLLALVIAHLQGVDIWYQILKAVTWLVGGDGLMWFVARLWFWLLFNTCSGGGLVESAAILCAMKVASRRFGWWQMFYIVAVGAVYPFLATDTVFAWTRPTTLTRTSHIWQFRVCWLVGLALLFVPMLIWTRSLIIAAGVVVASACSLLWSDLQPVFEIPAGSFTITLTTLIGWSSTVASLLIWGFIDRRRYRSEGTCLECGYSRAGLADSAACPECGVEPTLTPTPSPPPAPLPRDPAP